MTIYDYFDRLTSIGLDEEISEEFDNKIIDAIDHIQPGNFVFSIHKDKSQALKTTKRGLPISLG